MSAEMRKLQINIIGDMKNSIETLSSFHRWKIKVFQVEMEGNTRKQKMENSLKRSDEHTRELWD